MNKLMLKKPDMNIDEVYNHLYIARLLELHQLPADKATNVSVA